MNPHNMAQQCLMADWSIPDPGNGGFINADRCGVCNLSSLAAGETRGLAPPAAVGQWLGLNYAVDNGSIVVTSYAANRTTKQAVNAAGHNTITFTDAGEFVLLFGARDSGGMLCWRTGDVAGDAAGANGPTFSMT